jgi:Ca2+-binding RTX toxin-like protein
MAIINGTESSEVLVGTSSADSISGFGGNDTITGGGGNDTLTGGLGDDVFTYSARSFANDSIEDFGAGDRIDLRGYNVGDLATLLPYVTEVTGGLQIRTEFDGTNETIFLRNLTLAQFTADRIIFNSSSSALTITGPTFGSDLFGGNANDTITGSRYADALNGGAGDDVLIGSVGNDTLRGGAGNDVFGYNARGFSSDTIEDFSAGDRIDLRGYNIGDLTTLLPYVTEVSGGLQIRTGYDGNTETIFVRDMSLAQLTADRIIFNTSVSALSVTGPTFGSDLFGGNANDTITGSRYADALNGGAGDDNLSGSVGNDTLRGGAGNDVFAYNARGFSSDSIEDFGAGDRIDLRGYNIGDLTTLLPYVTEVSGGLQIRTEFDGSTENIFVRNMTLAQLTADRIVFNSSVSALNVTGPTFGSDLFGGNANDTITGSRYADGLNGGAGDDNLIGSVGNDTLRGGAGNDVFGYNVRGFSNDSIEDFSAGDRIDLRGYNVGDLATLLPYVSEVSGGLQIRTGFDGNSETIFVRNMTLAKLTADRIIFNSSVSALNVTGPTFGSDLFGGNANDTITGTRYADGINGGAGDDLLDGGVGTDTVRGGAGNDILIGDVGADTLIGGDGFDFASYMTADTAVTASLGGGQPANTGDAAGDTYATIEGLIGSLYFDRLIGNDFDNEIRGMVGNDTIEGRGGNDVLEGGAGVDVLDGGFGFDFATYANATSGLTLFMGGGTFNSGEANGDTHTSIEGLIGSNFSDIIGGDAGINELRGLNGNDFIYGRGGIDTLLGGDGNDVLSGGLDADRLEGGTGIDVAFYREATVGLTASLLTGGGTGEAAGDTYLDIENIWGSDFNDILTGDNNAGQVYGFAGNDVLSGLDGEDYFYGGQGFDTLTGGAGIDNFFFLSWNDHTNQYGTLEPYEGGDTFTDFTSGTDKIILSRYWFGFGNIGGPAAALTETHANFVTDGNVATGRPSLIWSNTNRTLSFDADGNGATQAVLLGTFQGSGQLALGDIWTA